MIKNERQYQKASEHVTKLKDLLIELDIRARPANESPKRKKIELSAVNGQIVELTRELDEYRRLRDGELKLEPIRDLGALPRGLIRQRIAAGLTQKQLADQLGVKEQQVQRDEANDYASAGLDRLQKVAKTLGISIDIPVTLPVAIPSVRAILGKLESAGVDSKFIRRKLVSRTIGTKVKDAAMPSLDLIGRLGRVFSWPAAAIINGPLPQVPQAVANYKAPVNASMAKSQVYTAYAHFCSELLLAASSIHAAVLPKTAKELRKTLIEQYGDISFSAILDFAWDHGIVVWPLNEKGGFHAAVFRFTDGRSAIVLKQSARYRWTFDILHEIGHLIFGRAGELSVVDADDKFSVDVVDEEKVANDFASQVIFDGKADELTRSVILAAGGDVRLFRSEIKKVSQRSNIRAGLLAQHTAHLLSASGYDTFWPHAHAIAIEDETQDPYTLAQSKIYQHVSWEKIGELDREILAQALDGI